LIPSWSTVDERLQSAPWHTVDGVHFGVPYMWGPNVLMYNTEVPFPKPPTSWERGIQGKPPCADGQSNMRAACRLMTDRSTLPMQHNT
jgi:putative spermidine/putrescine transport system substrate-binding protein